MSHTNNGKCPKCQEALDKFPGFYQPLREWFESLQAKHPEAHISEAGRGREAQELDFKHGFSKAHYGQSAHNFNCALDFFSIQPGKNIYDLEWFHDVLAKNLEPWLNWYGAPGAKFPEVPHVEPHGWQDLVKLGELKLVEEESDVSAA